MHSHLRKNTSTRLFDGYDALLANTHRFSFNEQERTDEIAGTDNHTTALYWEYDTRLGRRWNVDPRPNPSLSNYTAFADNPIQYIDLLVDSTQVFNSSGQFSFSINDNLPNQVHFIDPLEAYKILEKDPEISRDDWASEVRKSSVAVIGENSISDLKNIMNDPRKASKEAGFVAEISKSWELQFTQVHTPDRSFRHVSPEEAIENQYSQHELLKIFAAGHTHPVSFHTKFVGRDRNYKLECFVKPTPPNEFSPVNYQPVLFRSSANQIHPLVIASNYGIAVYSISKTEIPKKVVSNNFVDYNIFKNK